MAKVVLLQFDSDPESAKRSAVLSGVGAKLTVVEGEPRWPIFFDTILRERPDVVVIACSKIPQHAREAARYLGDGFNTRDIPVVMVDVAADDLDATRASAPNAKIVDRSQLAEAVAAAISSR